MMMLCSRVLFHWLSLAESNYNRTVLEQRTFIWRVLGTLRASMTRSRASSSPSRMLKSISSSDLDRLSIFMLDCEDRWKGEEKNGCFVPMFLVIRDTMTVGCFAPDMWCGLFEISLRSNLTAVQHFPPPPTTHQPHSGRISNIQLYSG